MTHLEESEAPSPKKPVELLFVSYPDVPIYWNPWIVDVELSSHEVLVHMTSLMVKLSTSIPPPNDLEFICPIICIIAFIQVSNGHEGGTAVIIFIFQESVFNII